MEPDVRVLRVTAVDQPRARELEVLLELARDGDRLRRRLKQEKVPRVARAARELQDLEVFVAADF